MEAGIWKHLMKKLAKLARRKKEMEHSQKAMKDQDVIV
tara:strand:+ start:615 stop:728 length:114 start_codon:yes stop_codon:yes gene_type:complete